MSLKLDEYDKKILFELDKNARISTSDIAKVVRKSKQFVDYRIKNFEERKIITGYITVIDYSKLGYTSIRVYLKFHNITLEEQKELENELIKDKEVWWLVTLEGLWDIGYAMAVKDVLDFYEYWDKIVKKYKRFISKKSIVIYTHIRQYPRSYIIGKKNIYPGTLVGASKEIIKTDDMDKRILKLISDNAKLPLLEISRKLNTSPQVIKGHMKKLEKTGIIQGYRALIDGSHFGYRYYKSYINLVNTVKIKELDSFCQSHPNILNINRTIGGRDYEIELQVKSFDEFEKIMNDMRSNFVGMIDEYEYIVAKEEKKMIYFPFE